MAKRLSKALREKRRWIGLLVVQTAVLRSEVEAMLDRLRTNVNPDANIRLMDFVPGAQRSELTEPSDLVGTHPEGGFAILRVDLKDARGFRTALSERRALENFGVASITTSGKIRLVRERLGLPRPKRKNR